MTLAADSATEAGSPRDGARGAARAVRAELARAAGDALLLPVRAGAYLARASALRRELRADLSASNAPVETAAPCALPARALRLFIASAEPSGERHAVHLVQALRAELARRGARAPELLALGGARTRALGVETVGDPGERAAMGLAPLASVPWYARLLERTGEALAHFRPDLVVPIDSPALFVPLARVARAAGVPTVHVVAPQYWAWAPWRVRAYRAAVELALTILPFEPAWFARHGVRTAHVGHPALDGLAPAPLPADARRTSLVILPGSRSSVIERNLPWMLSVALELRRRHPELELVLPHDREDLGPRLAELLESAGAAGAVRLAVGDLHGALARARAALTVSGTILIDLLHHRLPAAVVYRLGSRLNPRARFGARASGSLLTVPWFSSVNLIADAPVYWEACFAGEGPRRACIAHLESALFDTSVRAHTVAELDRASRRLGPPGAIERAAGHVLARAARGAA